MSFQNRINKHNFCIWARTWTKTSLY